jgi:hypothetical protein
MHFAAEVDVRRLGQKAQSDFSFSLRHEDAIISQETRRYSIHGRIRRVLPGQSKLLS